jgi:Haem-binding domain
MILGAIAGVFVLMQLIRPEHTNPPVTAELKASPEVMSVLKRACYDCHSNESKWPWYSNVAPVSWLVVRDVNEGRKELNFSLWESYEAKRKNHKLEEIEGEVTEGGMPMPIYVPMHPEAKLSDADKALIVAWTKERGAE